MLIIDRYISREILKLFLLLLGLLVVIFISFTTAVQLRQAAVGVITSSDAPKLILLNTIIALEILLPTTLFFGCIAALGRMQRDYETLTILSAGITPLHITFTVIKVAFLIAVAGAFLSTVARPWSYNLSYQIESEALTKLNINAVVPGQFVSLSASGHVLYAQSVDRKNEQLNKVFLQRTVSPENPSKIVISARHARLLPLDLSSVPVLQFTNGHVYRLDPDGQQDIVLDFKNLEVPLPEENKLAEYRRNAVPTAKLALSERPKDIAEFQWRLVTPLITLLLAALTVPLTTTKPRQARSRSMVIALLLYALVFGVTSVIRTAVEQGQIAANPGLWLAPMFPALLLLAMTLSIQLRNWHRGQE